MAVEMRMGMANSATYSLPLAPAPRCYMGQQHVTTRTPQHDDDGDDDPARQLSDAHARARAARRRCGGRDGGDAFQEIAAARHVGSLRAVALFQKHLVCHERGAAGAGASTCAAATAPRRKATAAEGSRSAKPWTAGVASPSPDRR